MHLPLLRHGAVYESADAAAVAKIGPDAVDATVSMANPGLIRRHRRRAEAGGTGCGRCPRRSCSGARPTLAGGS
jgi:formate dehydrogenase assembly factor FdhD